MTALRTADVDLGALLRALAKRPSVDLPVISAYLDLRPTTSGPDPTVRASHVVLRDRLRDLERELEPHTPAFASFETDRDRLTAYVNDLDPSIHGAALFACSGDGLWEAAELGVDLPDRVIWADTPDLVGLARLVDRPRALVALADTNGLRLFRARYGGLRELGSGLDDEPDDYTRTDQGGWSQARYQRHVEDHRLAFAKRAADAIETELGRGDDDLLVLAGDEVAMPRLRDQLSDPARRKLGEPVLRLEMRATLDEVADEALPTLEMLHTADVTARAEEALGEAAAKDMGAVGVPPVRAALERGQVMELFADERLDTEGAPLPELVRMAAATDAPVRFLADHEGLSEAGQVAALLRFKI
jgi:peptide chain release factor subunit 1